MSQREVNDAMALLQNMLMEGNISQETMVQRQEYLRQNGRLPEAGVGMVITERPPYKVLQLVPGGPVDRTRNVQQGDILEKVDGIELDRARGEKVRQLIIGPVSSVVTMQFREGTRRSAAGAFLIKVKRAAPNAGGDTRCAPPGANTGEHLKYNDDFDITTAERAVKHQYNPITAEWARSLINVAVCEAFASGAMRTAHHMKDLGQIGDQRRYVLKLSKDPNEDKRVYFTDVQMQMEAKMYAERYNARKPPKKVDFLAAYVLELVEREGEPICGVESFIDGDYKKYNNNWDWSDDQRNTPQAFSHFTWEASNNRLLICDIQGVGDMWTDPQIHSIDGEGYGKGNMGREGIEKFLNAHKCNAICKFLKLPQTGKLKEVSGLETVVRPDQGMTTMLDGAAGVRIQNERLQLAGKEAELKKEREALEEERRRLNENAGERAKDLEKARKYFEEVNRERERIAREKDELQRMMKDFEKQKLMGARKTDVDSLVAMGFPKDMATRAVADSQDLEGAVALCVEMSQPPAKKLPAVPVAGDHAAAAAAAAATRTPAAAASGTMQNRKVRMSKEVNDCKRMEGGGYYVYAQPVGEGVQALKLWDAVVVGPPDTPYENRAFELKIELSDDFPMDSPTVLFVTQIFHPNVWCRPDERYGKICLDVIDDKWSPAFSLQKVLLCVQQLLGDPNADAAIDPFVAEMCKSDPSKFKSMATEWSRKYAVPAAPLRSLLEMEFGVARSAAALRQTDMNADRAANYLMEGVDEFSDPTSPAQSSGGINREESGGEGAGAAAGAGGAAGGRRQPPPAYGSSEPVLPPGWQQIQDPASKRFYYYNEARGTVQWDAPTQ